MANLSLTQTDNLINKLFDVIKALDNDYNIEVYTPELNMERGKYHFNILPQKIVGRPFSDNNGVSTIMINVFSRYDMEADDEYQTVWTAFMKKMNDLLQEIYNKQNFPSGVSQVTVNMSFDNNLIESERMISLTLECEYNIFATR